jgi:hypothetical protein
MRNPIFEQLKTIVLPSLEQYQEDLTKHDFNILKDYKGPFLYSWRRTGTNLIKLQKDYKDYFNNEVLSIHSESNTKDFYKQEIIWITHPMNDKGFLYYDGANLKKITREQAQSIHSLHIQNIINLYEKSKTPEYSILEF